MIDIIFILALLLLIIYILIKKLEISPELYKSKSVYVDHVEKIEKPFYSQQYMLAGKPDSILHTKNGLVPVEVKSGTRPNKPYYSHIIQLISYCLLIEQSRGKPSHGLIQYSEGKPFRINYRDDLKQQLISVIKDMRANINSRQMPVLIEKNPNKCDRCGYLEKCEKIF